MTTTPSDPAATQLARSPAWLSWLPILGALLVSVSAARWQGLAFLPVPSAGDLFSRLSPLFFFALLIERFVEILMSIWRSKDANLLQAEVQRLVADGKQNSDEQLQAAKNNLIRYRAETLSWTMPIGFSLGLLLSASGVRALSPFIDPQSLLGNSEPGGQIWWFNISDTVFTGALLAGGADPIHKLLDLYRKVVEASAEKPLAREAEHNQDASRGLAQAFSSCTIRACDGVPR